MTTIAAMYAELAALRATAATVAAPDPEPFVPELPAATAPHGPRAARAVAQQLADTGHHSHLAAYGETTCVSGQCGPALDTLRGLL